MPKVKMILYADDKYHPAIECPGCGCSHIFDQKWTFNGNMDKPTFSPSMLIISVDCPNPLEHDENGKLVLGPDGRVKGAKDRVCHSFVRDGMIQFLSDCTHGLVGQTVEIPEI